MIGLLNWVESTLFIPSGTTLGAEVLYNATHNELFLGHC